MDGGVEDMRMTRGSEAGNERGRCEGDAGATLALMAILMAILVGMVGFAVDLGLAFNERRQDQASVDSAVLSGAYEWLALGGSEQAIFDEVVRLSYEDIDTSGMSATEWEAMWAGCTDPDAAGRGFTNPISASINGGAPQDIACITIKGGSSEQLRVRLPNQPVPTLFAGLLGFDTFQISAFAEAGGDVGDSSAVIPFMIDASSASASVICLKSPSQGTALPPCDGADQGDFGYVDFLRPSVDGTFNARCGSSGFQDRFAENVASGLDHLLSVRAGTSKTNLTTPMIKENPTNCGLDFPEPPNHGWTQTGNINVNCNQDTKLVRAFLSQADDADFADGLGGRLTRVPPSSVLNGSAWPTVDNVCNQSRLDGIDNRPLWEFIPTDGSIVFDSSSGPNHAPLSCNPTWITGIAANITTMARTNRLQQCFTDYAALGYTTPIFTKDTNGDGTYDVQESPRFAWIPLIWEDLADKSNMQYNAAENGGFNIKQMRPVFINTLFFGAVPARTWNVGEVMPSTFGNLAGVAAFTWPTENASMLPIEIWENPQVLPHGGVQLTR